MASQSTKLTISAREVSNSRSTRRLRREGQVPGVIYGGGEDAVSFAVDERELRHALAARGAVVELELDGDATAAVLKDAQRHPVRGHTMHVDFLRVRLDVAIHSIVALELIGGEDAPGAVEGGVLEHVTREVNIESLPTDIPERLQADVSAMQINDTLFLSSVTAPQGVTILDDLEETVVATLTPPKLQAELEALDEEAALEQETELVGEGEAPAEAEGEGRGRVGRRRRRRREPRVARARAPALRRGLGAGRLARRRAGQPGRALRAHPAQRRLRSRRGARAPLGAAAPQAEVRRALHRRPHRPRRPARRRAAAADLHERRRQLGRTGARGAARRARPRARGARRDRPALRRGSHAYGRRPGGPQRPEVAASGLGSPEFVRVRVGVGRPDSTDPDIVSAHVLGRWKESPDEVRALVERAADAAERIVLGDSSP